MKIIYIFIKRVFDQMFQRSIIEKSMNLFTLIFNKVFIVYTFVNFRLRIRYVWVRYLQDIGYRRES